MATEVEAQIVGNILKIETAVGEAPVRKPTRSASSRPLANM